MKKTVLFKFMSAIICSLVLMGCPEPEPELELSEIQVSPTTINVDASSGVQNISITSNTKWHVSSINASWVKISTTAGEGNSSTNLHFEENKDRTDRIGVITFITNDGAAQSSCTINQEGTKSTLSVSKTELEATYEAVTKYAKIWSNTKWKISDALPSWIKVTPKSGNGDSDITIIFEENNSTILRETNIVISTEDKVSEATIAVKQTGVNSSISVNPSNITLSANETSATASVTSNTEWSATSSEPWITITPSQGNGNGTIEILAEENGNTSVRSGVITVKTNDGSAQATINVEQNSASQKITVDRSDISVGASESSLDISVQSNTSWNITANESWVSTSKSSGSGNSSFTVIVSQNNSASSRKAQISIKSTDGSTEAIVNITQSGTTPTISVTPSNIEVGSNKCSKTVDVTSNTEWQASSSATWVTIENSSGSGNSKVILHIDNNTDYERDAVITFNTKDGSAKCSVTLKQEGLTPTITVSPAVIETSASTKKVSVTVNANIKWSVTTSEFWVAVDPSKGQGNGKITLTISENQYSEDRDAIVTVTSDVGNYSATISIHQKGASNKTTELKVDPSSLRFGANKGESKSFNIKSNTTWSIVECPNWINIKTSGNNTNATVTVTTNSDNNSTSQRSGYIKIKTDNQEKSESVIVTQECKNTDNCDAKAKNLVTLSTNVAFWLDFESGVETFQIMAVPSSSLNGVSEEQLKNTIKTGTSYNAKDMDGVVYMSYLTPNTDYCICTLGKNSQGQYGNVTKSYCRTKVETSSTSPKLTFSNVKYNSTNWYWTVTKNSYTANYYLAAMSGSESEISFIYGQHDAIIAWYLQMLIETTDDVEFESAATKDWQMDRNSNKTHLLLMSWGLYNDNSFSGTISTFQGKINSSSNTYVNSKLPLKRYELNDGIIMEVHKNYLNVLKQSNLKIYEVSGN